MREAASSGTDADKILANGRVQGSISSFPQPDLAYPDGLKPAGEDCHFTEGKLRKEEVGWSLPLKVCTQLYLRAYSPSTQCALPSRGDSAWWVQSSWDYPGSLLGESGPAHLMLKIDFFLTVPVTWSVLLKRLCF